MRVTARVRFTIMSLQMATRFDSAAFTFVASFAFTFVAITAGLASIAVVLNLRMHVRFLLTDNWETSTAAAWNIDSTTWGSRSSA